MAVKITLVNNDENGPIFEALDLVTNEEISCKNWFERSKEKWHIVLGANSANRKYIAHNEFNSKNKDGEYIVEDKTSGPRVLGTSQPDKKLVPFMTEEDRIKYDAIMARAMQNRAEQVAKPLTEEQKLEKLIAKAQARLALIVNADPKLIIETENEIQPTVKKKK